MLSSHYINIANTRYNQKQPRTDRNVRAAANTHTKTRNKMETTADRLSYSDPKQLCAPKKYQAAPSRRKVNAAAQTSALVLGFSQAHRGKWMKGSHDGL